MPGAVVTSGERVTLRTAEPDDAGFLQRGFADPAIRYPMGSPVLSRAAVRERLDGDDGTDRFLVCIDDDAGPTDPDVDALRRVGVVAVEDADWKRPELTYWLVPEVHGEGYGSEAVGLAVEYAFRSYAAPAVGAGAYPDNDASRGLLEALGFEQEGRRRGHYYGDGRYRDLVLYGLLREDWDGPDG